MILSWNSFIEQQILEKKEIKSTSLGTIFWDVILGWYYDIKQTTYWSETGCVFSVKNHTNFSSQNIVISSQNNIPKYGNNGHEQLLFQKYIF
jgi:hypothetical protein